MIPGDDISYKTFNAVSQVGHFTAGCLAVFAPVALTHRLLWGAVGAGLIVIFAGIKEGWWDRRFETPAVRGSSLEDFVFYLAGAALSFLLCWSVG